MVGLKGAGKTTILHRLIGEIVQGYRNRYNPINCGHKNVLVHPTAGQIHERFSESFTVWPSNVVPAEIVRGPPGDPPRGVSGFFGLNHW